MRVHGALADSASWNGVIEVLQLQGFPVVTVANPLTNLKGDAAYVAGVVSSIAGDVILVGRSYGGAVLAADLPERQTRLMAVGERPVTDAALGEGSGSPAWKTSHRLVRRGAQGGHLSLSDGWNLVRSHLGDAAADF